MKPKSVGIRTTGWAALTALAAMTGACGSAATEAPATPFATDEGRRLSAEELLSCFAGEWGASSPRFQASGRRLCDLQADATEDNAGNGSDDADPDDGGWDWEVPTPATQHSSNPSPQNLYGVTAFGVLAADVGSNERCLAVAARDVFRGMKARAEVDSPPDFAYLVFFGARYLRLDAWGLARGRYEAKLAKYGGALGLGEHFRDARHAAGDDGLIPYDLGWMIISARALETIDGRGRYAEDARVWGAMVADAIRPGSGYFDIMNAHSPYYVQGLAWTALALSWSGTSTTVLPALLESLLALQQPDGSWRWNADESEGDLQTTAHVVQNLALTFPDRIEAVEAIQNGAAWFAGLQGSWGGWEYAPGVENPMIDGEATLALLLARLNALAARPDPIPDAEGIRMASMQDVAPAPRARPQGKPHASSPLKL